MWLLYGVLYCNGSKIALQMCDFKVPLIVLLMRSKHITWALSY